MFTVLCVVQDIGDQLLPVSVPTWLKNSSTYQVLYENLLYCLFVFLGPLLILIVLNACLIQVRRPTTCYTKKSLYKHEHYALAYTFMSG